MIDEAKNKIPCCKKWTTITAENCIDKVKDNYNLGILTGKKE